MENLGKTDGPLFKEESLPLITFNNETNQFDINQEAFDIISSIKGPIGVIAVAGMYRTGKSYLLNRMLLNRSRGFGVGPSINPCTKGLWVWGTPIQGQTPDGNPINVLVVDSEGIGGLDEDNNHDMRIFSLALLLSSYFLYNSVGSIDENALSSLSLVVNLTQHIQFKSSQDQTDDADDFENLAEYLPSFMWVVRDFALQLVDENLIDISSNEYLERALQEKGGQTDPKNDIRKFIKLFFRERDCCTMIRPLTNEEELQNLERMELHELRQEFIEQVGNLRNKVINQVKPKTINNQVMDGKTWVQLIQQYISAINEGAVPNIQSSWTYICRQNIQNLVDQMKDYFEQELQEIVQLPMNQPDLEQVTEELKTATIQKFKKQATGDNEIVQEFLDTLLQYVNNKLETLNRENNDMCKRFSVEMLQSLFMEFDQELKADIMMKKEISFDRYEQIQEFYIANCFDFTEKMVMFQEAKTQSLQETLYFIVKHFESELAMQKQIECQIKERLEEQVKEAKEDLKQERSRVEEKLKQVLMEKSELEAQNQFLQEQYDNLKVQSEISDKEHKIIIDKLQEEIQNNVDQNRTCKDELEERIQHLQRQLVQTESEFDKEKALFEQQVQYLEKALQEKAAKEKDYMSEWQNQKSELSGELKQICQKYENDLKQLTRDLEEEREKSVELETALREKEFSLEEKNKKLQDLEQQYKQMMQNAQEQSKTLELTVNALKKDSENKITLQAKEKEGKFEQLQQQIQDMETQLREANDQVKQRDHEMKKERAIKDQKLQFLEMQLTECREQLEEAYKQHDQMVKAMKQESSPSREQKECQSPEKISSLQSELTRVQEEYNDTVKELRSQYDQSQEKVSDLELNLKLVKADYERECRDLKNEIQEIDAQKLQMQEKIKALEQLKIKIIEEQEEKVKCVTDKFEEELEQKENQAQKELLELQERSEEALTQLRNFYEIEKEKMEQRIIEEREKGSRRMHHYQEELELRMREDIQEKEEEIECLQNELRECEQRQSNQMTQMDHELSLKQQIIETLERQVKEQRDRAEYLEQSRNSAFEKQLEHFDQQRNEFNLKIDKLQMDTLEKDRLIAQLQHKLERVQDELERKKSEYETNKSQNDKEKKTLTDKLENTKKKLSDMQNEAMQQKLELGREQALLKQQIEFQSKKIEELQKHHDDSQRIFEEKMRVFKQEVQDEAASQIERTSSEKELWEQKYEQKRKQLKELEQSFSKNNQDLEKKINLLHAQVERIEEEKRLMEEEHQEEIMNLNSQIQTLDNNAGAAYFYGSAHAEDVLKLKGQLQDLEREYTDLQATYDRDKALWEGKCQFLESQKETYKRDLIESQKKFEITLEQLQKRGSLDKDKIESNQQALIKVIESKYKNQIKEMIEVSQCQANEAQQKVKRLENELKMMHEKLQMETRGKISEYGSMEKKLSDLQENEKRLLSEIDELKVERDRRIHDQQRHLEKEKEVYRMKLSEYEQKAKESEQRRASMMFEYEKERAKWQLERDNLVSQKSEMYEQIERLQIRKDQLLRENEKLRAENKGSRKYLFQNASNMSQQQTQQSNQSTSATRYMMTKSISGGGSNILNHAIAKMKENSGGAKFIGGGEDKNSSQHTTPNSKQNRYGH